MIYRVAGTNDYAAIKEYVDKTDYFNPIDPGTLGGHWVIAEHEGQVHGTIWFFASPPHAYIDYWTGKGRTALRLGQLVEALLAKNGVRYIHGAIHVSNLDAARLAIHGNGMLGHLQYILLMKELTDGQTEVNADHDNSIAQQHGAKPAPVDVATS